MRDHPAPQRGPGRPAPVLLFLPAMGVPGSFYQPFAARLEACGLAVRLLDIPGQGQSSLRASRGDDYGYREVVEELVPEAVQQARRDHPQAPLFLAGHSLGGQLAVLASAALAPDLCGMALVAAGTAHWRSWPAARRLRAALAVHAIAAIARVLPWYPGTRVGFGGDQSRRFMRDWSFNARTGRYRLEGSTRSPDALREALRRVALPVLAVSVDGDPIAPPGATRELLALLPAAGVTHLGARGNPAHTPWRRHFSWARQPAGVEEPLLAWVHAVADERRQPAPHPTTERTS